MKLEELVKDFYSPLIECEIKIQRWDNENYPTVLFEGFTDDIGSCLDDFIDEDVNYLSPYYPDNSGVGICVELY